ncbi:MAG: metallophosphoesterase [Betaproteobacteria bacterium]
MRTLVHLSDLHFGRTDESVIESLVACVAQLKPDLVAVSGDLTQRARTAQFMDARAFLDRLPPPHIVVPGNHDVPLHDVLSRFLRPLAKYRRYISDNLQPTYIDQEIAVLGVNTARALTIKGGRINAEQIAWVQKRLCSLSAGITKIIVTHHPFDLPAGHQEADLVGRAGTAMEQFASCGVDLFLAGHLHVSHAASTAARYQIKGHAALVVQAGTATSTRARGESNSFNVVRIDRTRIEVERLVWIPKQASFSVASTQSFEFLPGGWVPL